MGRSSTLIDDLTTRQVKFQFLGTTAHQFGITEQDWRTETLGLGGDGSLEHRGMITFGKDHTLRV